MSEFNQNRFSPTKFDAARSEYVGDGKQLTAKYFCKGRTWCATVTWKKGYSGVASLTTLDESAMKSALLRLDSTVRFIGQVNTAPAAPVETLADKTSEMLEALRVDPQTGDKAYISACQLYKQKPKSRTAPAEVRTQNGGRELSFADAKALEAMRVDLTVSAQSYRNACAKLGVPPRPRPTQAAAPAAQAQQPVSIIEQLAAWPDFQREHGEIFQPPFGDQNVKIIAQYLLDEGNLPSTPANLATAYRELKAAGCFRDARTLTRGMDGDLQVVQPYSHETILAMRRQQVADVANQPPVGLSDVDRDCWRAVHQAYPQLPVNSPAFKKCCADTLQKWAFEHVAEEHPDWFTTNAKGQLESAASKRAEVRAAVDRVITAWVRAGNPNLGQGNKTIKDTRIWLG